MHTELVPAQHKQIRQENSMMSKCVCIIWLLDIFSTHFSTRCSNLKTNQMGYIVGGAAPCNGEAVIAPHLLQNVTITNTEYAGSLLLSRCPDFL